MGDPSHDVLIVGAGPAGLAAAFFAVEHSAKSVCLLDRNREPGRKFLLSGSGQCNVTHGGPIDGFLSRYGDVKKGRFVKAPLLEFDNRATVDFFQRLGVPLFQREDGKIFPVSLRSRDLVAALVSVLNERGVDVRTDCSVESVRRNENGFAVRTDRDLFQVETLILATGGCSYPGTGSTGDGYRIAERLGHRIVEPKPGLVPVIVRDYPFGDAAGISFPSTNIEIVRKGRRIRSGRGDVLLTHRGLSGPGILDPSRWIEADDTVRIAPTSKPEILPGLLAGKKTLKNALVPLGIPERFLVRLLEVSDISPDRPAAEVSRSERKKLEAALVGFPFVVERLGDWNEAMTTVGGVALDEVDRRTMESRLVPGLFFCGEILDVDGDCGGYNIQFALSSGFLAGRLGRSSIVR